MARLEYVLKGVKRVEAEKGERGRTRLPITPASFVKGVWEESAGYEDDPAELTVPVASSIQRSTSQLRMSQLIEG